MFSLCSNLIFNCACIPSLASSLSIILSYCCSASGHVFLIDYQTVGVLKVWQLLLEWSGGVAITSMAVHKNFIATGSEDGYLRIWPSDLSAVVMETGVYVHHL